MNCLSLFDSEPWMVWCLCCMPPPTSLGGRQLLWWPIFCTSFFHMSVAMILHPGHLSKLSMKIVANADSQILAPKIWFNRSGADLGLCIPKQPSWWQRGWLCTCSVWEPFIFFSTIPQLHPEPWVHEILYLKKVSRSIRMLFYSSSEPSHSQRGWV